MSKVSNEKIPLLLTGTINPTGKDIHEKSVRDRLRQYEDSIIKYICQTAFNPIVFVENSNFPFDAKRFETMALKNNKGFEFVKGTMCKEEVKEHGKGYGDALLIYEGLTKSKSLENIDFFYKMTGRLFLKNSKDIIKNKKII